MKTLTLLLLLISSVGYGQSDLLTIDSTKSGTLMYHPSDTKAYWRSFPHTIIALSFSPAFRKVPATLESLRSYYVLHVFRSEYEFEQYYTKVKYDCESPCKYVEVRVNLDGKITDYTFEEFKKLMWPEITK